MLVLSRQEGESIWIGSAIEIKVIDVRGDRVRLGVTAPKELIVLRDELQRREEKSAASETPDAASGGEGRTNEDRGGQLGP